MAVQGTARIYRSTDTSAPILCRSGAGHSDHTICNVLLACLVDGYGSKTAAGWSNPYSFADATNQKEIFQQGSASYTSQAHVLQVHDTLPTGGAGTSSHTWRAAESASAIDTFGNEWLFAAGPGFAQGKHLYVDTSTTEKPWIVIADRRTFLIAWKTDETVKPNQWTIAYFGDIASFQTEDWACAAIVTPSTGLQDAWKVNWRVGTAPTNNNMWLARNYAGTAGGIKAGLIGDYALLTNDTLQHWYGELIWPHPREGTNTMEVGELWVFENDGAADVNLRGKLRVVKQFMHDYTNVSDGDTASGRADKAEWTGKTYEVRRNFLGNWGGTVDATSDKQVMLWETSQTWEST